MVTDTLQVQELTPIDRYLAEQADLTAVDRFARHHLPSAVPAPSRYYRDLVPLQRPGAGQQYGFEVDLDACTGCKACVTACHNLNGLDAGESWRTVGLVHGGSEDAPRPQSVTTGCHHCVDPACLKGCPVNAYEKDPITGIVAHLDDQCIGCRYCVLTCPYEVPRYNAGLGIVRKCDLCAGRLAAGEAPACVQSCPNAAIRVSLVDTASAVAAAVTGPLVPGAPASTITVPTTTYRSTRPLEELAPATASTRSVRPGQAHPPLAVMLVLTQLAVGTSVVDLAAGALASPAAMVDELRPVTAAVALAVSVVALAASVCHLGRPAYAFRAVLGLRRSWLSREIVAFGAFAALAAAHGWVLLVDVARPLEPVLALLAVLAGVVGVACSALVYAVTGRAWWGLWRTAAAFASSSLVLGSATVLATTLASAVVIGGPGAEQAAVELGPLLAVAVATVTALKLAAAAVFLRRWGSGPAGELHRSARLLLGSLRAGTRRRFAAGLAALVLASAMAVAGTSPVTSLVLAGACFVALVTGELLERSQFFTAVAPPRMPVGH